MKRNWIWLIAVWLLLALTACSQGIPNNKDVANPQSSPNTTNNRPNIEYPDAETLTDEENTADSPILDPTQYELAAAAKENLAQRLGTTPENIQLVEIEAVEWPDASLGCPQQDQLYAQVITSGFRILLEANDKHYTYHADNQKTLMYCEKEEVHPLPDNETSDAVNLAKADLAQRLGIPADRIEVIAVLGQEFPADAFDCQTKKERIAREEPLVVIFGKTILLSAEGNRYEYHASSETVIFCGKLSQ